MPGDATPPPELPPGLLAEYLESARSQLGVLAGLARRLSAAGGDREALEALRIETHKVHGSAGSYGFMEASRLAAGRIRYEIPFIPDPVAWTEVPESGRIPSRQRVRWHRGLIAAM